MPLRLGLRPRLHGTHRANKLWTRTCQAAAWVLDSAALHRAFGLPGSDGEPVHHSADLGPLQLVCLDSTIPGEDGGRLDRERLAWLDATLAQAPTKPTIVALHYAPLRTGIPEVDARAARPGS